MAIRSARLSNVPYRQKIPLYTLCSNAFRKTGMWKLTTSSIRNVTVGIIASLRTAGYRRPWFTGRSCQDADCRSGCRERKGAAEDDQKRAFRSVDCNSRRICSAHCGSSGVVRDHYGRGSPSLARGSDHQHHCRRNRDSRCRNCQYCGRWALLFRSFADGVCNIGLGLFSTGIGILFIYGAVLFFRWCVKKLSVLLSKITKGGNKK